MGIPPGTILSRVKREGWTREIQKSKGACKMRGCCACRQSGSSSRNDNATSVPGGIRTPNLLIRSQKLYPVELQALRDREFEI